MLPWCEKTFDLSSYLLLSLSVCLSLSLSLSLCIDLTLLEEMILQLQGNNIFKNFPTQEYKKIINVVESAILSTDLALYFK